MTIEELTEHLERTNPGLSDFLLHKEIRDKFLSNVSKHHGDLQSFINASDPPTIGNSFTWLDTPEGDTFWLDLDSEFIKFMENNKSIKPSEDITNFVKRFSH